jgi:endonuclease/exonuclease/phosphatase family metal-dependent hydrolase
VVGSRHPECYHPRICSWGLFRDADGREIAHYNLHLDNESAAAREESVRLLLDRMNGGAYPSIVTGDFNAGEDDVCVESLRAAGLRDSYRVTHPDANDVATYHGFGHGENSEKIDYIWIDRAWQVRSSEIVRSQIAGMWPSDHCPVVADLS